MGYQIRGKKWISEFKNKHTLKVNKILTLDEFNNRFAFPKSNCTLHTLFEILEYQLQQIFCVTKVKWQFDFCLFEEAETSDK